MITVVIETFARCQVVSFALAVVFIIRLFSTSAFRVPKKGFFIGENELAKVTQNFRQVWGLRATILRTSKNCPAPTVMSRDWPKIYLQVGPKVAKFHFHHSKQRKQLFLQKM